VSHFTLTKKIPHPTGCSTSSKETLNDYELKHMHERVIEEAKQNGGTFGAIIRDNTSMLDSEMRQLVEEEDAKYQKREIR
jgi:hypothetical protein